MALEVKLTKFRKFHFICGAEICMAEKHRWYTSARYIKAIYGRRLILTLSSKVSNNQNTQIATNNLIIN
jgi:hypothetical protein